MKRKYYYLWECPLCGWTITLPSDEYPECPNACGCLMETVERR